MRAYPANTPVAPNPLNSTPSRTPVPVVPRFRALSTFAPDYGYALMANVKRAEQAGVARAAHLRESSIPLDNPPLNGSTTIFDRVFSGTDRLGDTNPYSPVVHTAGGAGPQLLTIGGHSFEIPSGNPAETFHAIRTRMVTAFRAVAAGTSTPRDMAFIFGTATVSDTAGLELEMFQLEAMAVNHGASKGPPSNLTGLQHMRHTHPHHEAGPNTSGGDSDTAVGIGGAAYGRNESIYGGPPATRLAINGTTRKVDAHRRMFPATPTNPVSPERLYITSSRSRDKGKSSPIFSHTNPENDGENDHQNATPTALSGSTLARRLEKIKAKGKARGIQPGVYGVFSAPGGTRAGQAATLRGRSRSATWLTSQAPEKHRSKRARVSPRSTMNSVHAGVKGRKQDEEDYPYIPPELRRSSRKRRSDVVLGLPSLSSPLNAQIWPPRSQDNNHPQGSPSNFADDNDDFPVIPPELRRSSRKKRPLGASETTASSKPVSTNISQPRNEEGNYPQGLFFGNFANLIEFFERTGMNHNARVEKYMEGLVTIGGRFAATDTLEGDDRCTECVKKGETTACKVLKKGHENYTNTLRCARCIGVKLKCSHHTGGRW